MNSEQLSNPPFPTPQPDQLQSEESKSSTLENLVKEQKAKSDTPEDLGTQADASTETGTKFGDEDLENLTYRHMPTLDTPPD
ncbi:MAG TPA: hypothetical protein V6D29_02310 [Leptolyngbyaceae cyanobacterium]